MYQVSYFFICIERETHSTARLGTMQNVRILKSVPIHIHIFLPQPASGQKSSASSVTPSEK